MRRAWVLVLLSVTAGALIAIVSIACAQTIVGEGREKIERNVLLQQGPKGVQVRPPFGTFRPFDPFFLFVPGWPLATGPAQGNGLERPPQFRERATKP